MNKKRLVEINQKRCWSRHDSFASFSLRRLMLKYLVFLLFPPCVDSGRFAPFLGNWISPLFVGYIAKSKYYSHCIIELFEPWAVIKRTANHPNATATTKTSSKAFRRSSTRATRTKPAPLPTTPRSSSPLRQRSRSSGTHCVRLWRRTSFWGIEWSSWRHWWLRRRAGWMIWREDSLAIWINCKGWGESRGTMETGGSHYDLFTLILTPDSKETPQSNLTVWTDTIVPPSRKNLYYIDW